MTSKLRVKVKILPFLVGIVATGAALLWSAEAPCELMCGGCLRDGVSHILQIRSLGVSVASALLAGENPLSFLADDVDGCWYYGLGTEKHILYLDLLLLGFVLIAIGCRIHVRTNQPDRT